MPAAKTRANSSSRRRSSRRRSLPANLVTLVSMTFFGRLFLITAVIALVLAINLLISQNQYDLFFVMTGIELVAVAAFYWIRFLLKK